MSTLSKKRVSFSIPDLPPKTWTCVSCRKEYRFKQNKVNPSDPYKKPIVRKGFNYCHFKCVPL